MAENRATAFFFFWIPPLVWMSLIFYLSSLSGLPDFHTLDLVMKKGAHVAVYAILYFLLFRAFHALHPERGVSSLRTCLWAGTAAFLYAVSDEIHQAFVPLRRPSAVDVGVDSAGILLMYMALRKGTGFFSRLLRRPKRRGDSSPSLARPR